MVKRQSQPHPSPQLAPGDHVATTLKGCAGRGQLSRSNAPTSKTGATASEVASAAEALFSKS
jgi:hypothetical protein